MNSDSKPLHRKIGHIRVESLLGKGAMGDVYLGFDETLHRHVALKFIPDKWRLSGEHKARLQVEARVLSKLDHRHICRIYDVLEENDEEVLVLEHIDGITLRKWLEGDHPFKTRLAIAIQIADGLAAAHDQGIIHRDLKPENVMVSRDHGAKILDFGLARSDQTSLDESVFDLDRSTASSGAETSSYTTSGGGQIVGTVMYMSPEQVQAQPATPLSDIYALGLTFQHLFSGDPPFRASTQADLLQQVLKGPTIDQSKLDRDLQRLLRDMLRVQAPDRPNARQVLYRLRRIATRTRRRLFLLTATLLALASVAGIVKYAYDVNREREMAVIARNDAESLVNFLIEDLYKDLEGIGRLDLMEHVLDRADSYYARLKLKDQDERNARRAWLSMRRSSLKTELGHLEDAFTQIQRAINLYDDVLQHHPDNPDWSGALGECYYDLGYLNLLKGDRTKAEVAYQRAIDIHREQAQKYPDELEVQLRYLRSFVGIGSIRLEEERYQEAKDVFAYSLNRSRQLAGKHPENQSVWRKVGVDLFSVADALFLLERSDEALHLFEEALQVDRMLEKRHPDDMQHRFDVMYDLLLIGQTHLESERPKEAQPLLDESHQKALELHTREPLNVRWIEILATIEFHQGKVFQALGQQHQAQAAWLASQQRLQPLLAKPGLIDPKRAYVEVAYALGERESLVPLVRELLDLDWREPDFMEIARSLGVVDP